MALARTRRERQVDYWPGFVDALSTLILGIVFLLSVFVVVQFVLSQEVTGKDTALSRLSANRTISCCSARIWSVNWVRRSASVDKLALLAVRPSSARAIVRCKPSRLSAVCSSSAWI